MENIKKKLKEYLEESEESEVWKKGWSGMHREVWAY